MATPHNEASPDLLYFPYMLNGIIFIPSAFSLFSSFYVVKL